MKKYTEAETQGIIKDYFDPERVVLICSKHGYIGGSKKMPHDGCAECSTVFWRHWAAKKPPHERAAALERMVELVNNLIANEAQLAEIKLNRIPKVEIEKGN